MDSEENRFAHLLKPIRELTKNWDIDVASELNDYLEELDEMCITFDGGKIQLNFAEAALLIQGSTCIYSKKVELLYNLVYQTLDLINDRNKKRDKQAAASEEGGAGRAVTNHDTDNDATFLSHDESVSGRSPSDTDSNTCVRVAPLPPESLILPEASEKQKLPLISLKGEVLCSCKDFRMNTFTAGALGLIHLYLDTDIQNSGAPVSLYQDEGGTAQAAGDAGFGGSDDIEDGGGDGGDNFLPLEDNGMEMEQGVEEHIDRHRAPREGRVLRERREVQPSEEDLIKQRSEEERAHAANMWRLHDSTAMFGKAIPLKTGKYYKVPDGLDDAGKRKRKGPSVLPDFCSWFTGTYDPPERKLKNGPAFTDLNYVYVSKMKEKLRTRRRILRKKGVVVSDEELRRTYLQSEEEEEEQLDGLRLPNLQGADDDHSDDEHEPLPDDIPTEFGDGQDFILTDAELEHLSYEDLVKKAVEQFLVNSQRYGQETALSLRVQDWEEKIRPKLAIQEERPVFDIHDYGNRIVAAIGDVGHKRSFASIVHGMDNFEVCKYMLASLQLANDYTVEVDRAEGLEESIDTMGLTLLSTHRVNDRFKTLMTSAATGSTS